MSRRLEQARRNPPSLEAARAKRRWQVMAEHDGLRYEFKFNTDDVRAFWVPSSMPMPMSSFGFSSNPFLTRRERLVRALWRTHAALERIWRAIS